VHLCIYFRILTPRDTQNVTATGAFFRFIAPSTKMSNGMQTEIRSLTEASIVHQGRSPHREEPDRAAGYPAAPPQTRRSAINKPCVLQHIICGKSDRPR
jgi:hypothetical protein